MRTRGKSFWLISLLFLVGSSALAIPSDGLREPVTGVRLLRSDERAVVVDVEIGAPGIEPIPGDSYLARRVVIPGFPLIASPGLPQLPEKLITIAIPPDADLRLEARSDGYERLSNLWIAPAPTKMLLNSAQGLEGVPKQPQFVEKQAPDSSIYDRDAFYPGELARIVGTGYMRDQRFVQIAVHPVQFNPVTRSGQVHRSIRVELLFQPAPGMQGRSVKSVVRPESAAFESILDSTFLNAASARMWRRAPARDSSGTGSPVLNKAGQDASAPRWKISILTEGLYRLGYEDLKSAGLPVDTLDPRGFRMFNGGHEVTLEVSGEQDGRFDSQDEVVFFGSRLDTKYSNTNIYWLSFGPYYGLRMSTVDGSPAGGQSAQTVPARIHREENLFYRPGYPFEEDADHWFWDLWLASALPPSAPLTFDLPNLAAGSGEALFRISVQGFTSAFQKNPDHHVRVLINDQFIGDLRWDGETSLVAELPFPQSLLLLGANRARLEVPGDTGAPEDGAFLNWFEIGYRARTVAVADVADFATEAAGSHDFAVPGFYQSDVRVYDVTDAERCARLSGVLVASSVRSSTSLFTQRDPGSRRFIALSTGYFFKPLSIESVEPTSLQSEANGADYILISHRDFLPAAERLAAKRRSDGLRVSVVDVEAVYNEFNYGVYAPQAIHDFLAYAYRNWQSPAPAYVLLMGDGNDDPKNYTGNSDPGFIPPYLGLVDPWIGETAAENRFVTVSGDDLVPDLFLGRLPVNTLEEADVVVDKILAYESGSGQGDAPRRLTFVTDNIDFAGNFPALSDQVIATHVPKSVEVERLYLGVTSPSSDAIRLGVIRSINEGRAIIHYVGHSAVQFWSAEGLFSTDDLPLLSNESVHPIFVPMTCYDGYFQSHLKYEDIPFACFAEQLIRARGRGSVASWTATGLGIATGHAYLDDGFFDAAYGLRTKSLGQATYLGKLHLYQSTRAYRDLMSTYCLLGDPALRLNLVSAPTTDVTTDEHR